MAFSLSERAQEMMKDPLFVTAVTSVWADLYNKETNPNGYINLAVAENVLMAREMCDKIQEIQTKFPIQPHNLNYTDFAGDPQFRSSLAHLFQHYIFRTNVSVNPNDFVVCNGAGSVLEQLATSLCNEDEYIMIPAPMYLAFPNDFGKRFNCRVLPVPIPYDSTENRFVLSLDVVCETFERATSEGKRIRGFLLCTPDNPTGEICPSNTVLQLMKWCEQSQIHFISDEVYALSVFSEKHDKEFVSAGKLMLEEYENNRCEFTHLVYSFSKDFTLNGFRIGVLYTHNPQLLQVFRSCSYFTGVSSHTQQVMTELLRDDKFIQYFIKTNAERMTASYTSVCEILKRNNVKYIEAKGGVFLFIYLGDHIRQWLQKDDSYEITTQNEQDFWRHVLNNGKVNISAGSFFLCFQAPGWFRICFTATTADTLQIGLDRVFKCIQQHPIDYSN